MSLTPAQRATVARLQRMNPRTRIVLLPRGAPKGKVGVKVIGRYGAQKRIVHQDGRHTFERFIGRPNDLQQAA